MTLTTGGAPVLMPKTKTFAQRERDRPIAVRHHLGEASMRRQLKNVAAKVAIPNPATPRTCPESPPRYTPDMVTIKEVEKLALGLADSPRALLAALRSTMH